MWRCDGQTNGHRHSRTVGTVCALRTRVLRYYIAYIRHQVAHDLISCWCTTDTSPAGGPNTVTPELRTSMASLVNSRHPSLQDRWERECYSLNLEVILRSQKCSYQKARWHTVIWGTVGIFKFIDPLGSTIVTRRWEWRRIQSISVHAVIAILVYRIITNCFPFITL